MKQAETDHVKMYSVTVMAVVHDDYTIYCIANSSEKNKPDTRGVVPYYLI